MSSLISNLKQNRRLVAVAAAASAALIIIAVIFYVARLNRRITDARERQSADARVEVRESALRAPSTDGLALYLNAAAARATATLDGVRYLATSGGLIALGEGGQARRRYTTLDGLPDNDLTALAVFRGRLFVGTSTAGLLAFDGERFTGYSFINPKAARVSALVATDSELLIGTLDGGLFEFDGERFSRRFNATAGADFSRVTALLPLDSRLYIGTQDRGLYVWREAHVEHVGTSEGLPSPNVTALAALPPSFSDKASVAVATDFAVVGLTDSNEVRPISAQPNVTSIAVVGGRLWAGLFTGGVVELGRGGPAQSDQNRAAPVDEYEESTAAEIAGLPRSAATSIYSDDGAFWALTSEGAYARAHGSAAPAFEPIAASLARDRLLTGEHVTGLAFDGAGRLWVGYFDRGVDCIAMPTDELLSHIEDDRVREVNFITFDGTGDRLLVATSRGLVVLDDRMKQSVYTREQSGVINDSIAHVSITEQARSYAAASGALEGRRALVLATAGGLTELAGGRARSLTAFHGLASNHLYTSAAIGSRLFVGSLAGLVELEGLRVVRTYKTSNSRLPHDWVTALAEVDGTLYIGTYGGGVSALLPTGEWVNFSDEVGQFEVNQNAMHYDGERLYLGTGDRGLLVYNTRARRWSTISAGLPSQSVTAITSDSQAVYVGTLNGLMRIEKRILG
jgi:ligand-binding sensor domain-containing protein